MALLTASVAAGIWWLTVRGHPEEPTVAVVAIASLLTALATGFGAVPFLFSPEPGGRLVGQGNALAAGLMLGASISLTVEGWNIEEVSFSSLRMAGGAVLGILTVWAAHHWLSGKETVPSPDLLSRKPEMRRMILIVGVMTVHSFAEGMGVGVAYGEVNGLGDFIAASIAVHNIPEGLAICLVLIPEGTSVAKAAAWCVFSSLPQPLIALPAFLSVLAFRPLLPAGLGFAAGAMLWMVFLELFPEARETLPARTAAALMGLGAAGMLFFQYGAGF